MGMYGAAVFGGRDMRRTIVGAVLSSVGHCLCSVTSSLSFQGVAGTGVGYIRIMNPVGWKPLPYDAWAPTCDTLPAHAQLLGKLAVALAPPEPQLQHAALRLTARGWETLPLPAPDGSGALVVTLDLQRHENIVEHSDGRAERITLWPNRAAGDVDARHPGRHRAHGRPRSYQHDATGGVVDGAARRGRRAHDL